MRHGKKFNHLRRLAAHRKALLANLAKSLVLHKRINTTVAKAKALRKFVEPILTKAKHDTTHSRRVVFASFQDKAPVKELFNEIAPKITDRPGGYTRIIRLGNRWGDNAEMCLIELVDYNELLQKEPKPAKAKTRRSRGKAKATTNEGTEVPQAPTNEKAVAAASAPKASQPAPSKPQDRGSQELQTAASQPSSKEQDTGTPEGSGAPSADVDKDK